MLKMRLLEKNGITVLILGIIFIFIGIVFNQWTLTKLLSPDGAVKKSLIIAIWVFDLILLLTGSILVRYRKSISIKVKENIFRPKKKNKIFLLFIFCFYLFIIFEGSARLALSIARVYDIISKGVNCNAVWRLRWIRRHNGHQKDIYHIIDVYNPTRGWAIKPDIKEIAIFGKGSLNTNSRGIRGKIEYDYRKNPNKARILILGDSFTFGEEVADYGTYPYYLQQLLPNAEVINLGVHGYGHDQMLLYLKEEGLRYKPDIVILGFIASDMERNMLDFRDYAKPRFELVNHQLRLKNSLLPQPAITLKKEFWRPKFFDLLSILRHKYLLKTGIYAKKKKDTSEAILTEIVTTAQAIGAIPIFVYLPEVRNEDLKTISLAEKEFIEYCKRKDIQYILLSRYFASEIKKGSKFKGNGHYSPEENQIVAQGIKEYLVNQQVFLRNKSVDE